MKNITGFLVTLTITFLATNAWSNEDPLADAVKTSQGYAMYIAPINIQPYVKSPQDVVQGAIAAIGAWRVTKEGKGSMTIMLDNYKANEIIVDITYTDKKITIIPVSDRRLDCKESGDSCRVRTRNYNTWMNNLRRNMTKIIHRTALKDAQAAT